MKIIDKTKLLNTVWYKNISLNIDIECECGEACNIDTKKTSSINCKNCGAYYLYRSDSKIIEIVKLKDEE